MNAARALLFGLVVGLAAPALAQPVNLRPIPRPDHLQSPVPQVAASVAAPSALISVTKPRPRPDRRASQPAPQIIAVATARSIRPPRRPGEMDGKERKGGFFSTLFAAPVAMRPPAAKAPTPRAAKGSVCADPSIRGESIPAIAGKMDGCGIAEPVRVTEVEGVALSVPATMDCATAKALKTWVAKGLQPAFGADPVVKLKVAAHYSCRPRNGRKGAKISEHGKGKAIDIAGLQLASGSVLTVLEGYKSRQGAPLRAAHKAACGVFGTTLGPGSDGHHENHLHFDTAKHRSGPYCR
jgi:hypothetical protein